MPDIDDTLGFEDNDYDESIQQLIEYPDTPEFRHTVNAELPPPYPDNTQYMLTEDVEPPLVVDVREKLRTLSNLVQEKIVTSKRRLQDIRNQDHLPYPLGSQLNMLDSDHIRNRIRVLEDYGESVQNTMIRFEDYINQQPEQIFDLSHVEIPTAPPTGFEDELNSSNTLSDHIINVSVLALLREIKRLEQNLDLRAQEVPNSELYMMKGKLTAARVVLESML